MLLYLIRQSVQLRHAMLLIIHRSARLIQPGPVQDCITGGGLVEYSMHVGSGDLAVSTHRALVAAIYPAQRARQSRSLTHAVVHFVSAETGLYLRRIRSEERRVGKGVDLGGRRSIKKKKKTV